MATAPTTFHGFNKLPQELRDDIWRECLPRRVLEIDVPHDHHNKYGPCESYCTSSNEDGRPRQRHPPGQAGEAFVGCFMRQTSKINATPPVISRVCLESRRVAFETGILIEHGHGPWEHGPAELGNQVRTQWYDRARDAVVHLHHSTQTDVDLMRMSDMNNPIQLLRDAVPLTAGVRSISLNFLTHHKRDQWKACREMLQGMREVMVCLKVVCIHVATEPAIQSGLFGRLGEERVVMVNALDGERVGQFRDLWEKYGSAPNVATDNDFKAIAETRVLNGRYTIQEWVEEIKTRWVWDSWYDRVGWWVTLFDGPRRVPSWHQIDVPGLLKEEVWLKAPERSRHRDAGFSMCQGRWISNRGHSWVEEAYLRMPEFLPTIMFRLCTNEYYKDGRYWSSKPI